MKVRLKPIRPKRISDQVFDQLRELIFSGELNPGDQVMTERELCEVLNVSRTSVREAINKLVALGFLEQRQGQGTFVRSLDQAAKIPLATVMEAKEATLIDLLEVRMGIECNSAALASQRASSEDLRCMALTIAEMEKETQGGGIGHRWRRHLSHGRLQCQPQPSADLFNEKPARLSLCGDPRKPAAPL